MSYMVINYFHIEGVSVNKAKTNPPLIINPNAEKPFAVASQGFEPISWRYTQKIKRRSSIQQCEFALSNSLDVNKTLDLNTLSEPLSVLAAKTSDHANTITYIDIRYIHFLQTGATQGNSEVVRFL